MMGSTLMRSRLDRRIAGICGGLAQHLGWDSTLIRVLWVCLVLFGGTGVLAYLVLWIAVPEEPFGLPPYVGYAPPPQAYPGAPQGYPGGPAPWGTQHSAGQTYTGPTGQSSAAPPQGPGQNT